MKTYFYRGTWSKIRPLNLKIGFAIALSFVFFAFQLSVQERESIIPQIIHEDIIKDAAVIPHREKVFVPPTANVATVDKKPIVELFEIEEVQETVADIDPFENVEVEDFIDEPVIVESGSKTTPMIAPKIDEDDGIEDILIFAQNMPVFGDCDAVDEDEKRTCSEANLLRFIHSKLKYPSYAREVGLEGTVFAEFVIGKDGKIRDLKLIREIGGGTSEEIKRVIGLMPDWIPGKQGFRPVSVRMTIPMKFQLQ